MARFSANSQGVLFMVGSMAFFTMNDAAMKSLSGVLPLAQSIFLRGVPTVLMMLALALALGAFRARIPRADRVRIGLRNLTEIGAAYFFLTALFNMPIANATAILQILPLTVTLAGALFLGAPIGWRRMAAIAVGFVGVLIIVRPGLAGFNVYALYALAAVALVTTRELLSRRLSREVPTILVALSNAVSVTAAFGLVLLFSDWVPVPGAGWVSIAAASVLIIGAYFCSVAAMRVGDLAVIAPYRYTALLWAMLLGVLVFGEWPDIPTLLGAGIIVATGIYSWQRERRLAT